MTTTSVAVSLDGTKFAYIESGPTHPVLHLLRPGTGSQGTVAFPVTISGADIVTNWNACPSASAPCLINVTLGGIDDVIPFSSPFYAFDTDAIYLGDAMGFLHKIAGAFNGGATPPTLDPTGWPITVDNGFSLASPAFDFVSGNIFIGDLNGQISYVRDTASTTGTCASGSPPCLGSTNLTGRGRIVDAPIVNSTTGHAFFFTSNTGDANAGVVEVNTSLTTESSVDIGTVTTTNIHQGSFDAQYWSSTGGTGNLWVCGGTFESYTTFLEIPIASDVMSSSFPAIDVIATSTGTECSPITETLVGGTDYLLFSVLNNGFSGWPGCTAGGGCMFALGLGADDSGSFVSAAGLNEPGGTSGIIIDNLNATNGSNLYFTNLGAESVNACTGAGSTVTTGGCAIQATQTSLSH